MPHYAGYLFAYFTGEGTADGEQIRYALSRGNDPLHWRRDRPPLGPWTERGTILSKRPEYGILATGHHSVVNTPGTDDWYIVYHRFALNGPGKPAGDGTHRETTVDRMEFAADGSILPVVPTLESIRPVRGVS
ncbi:family 43 glycosylhydrolase [Streptomyces sp. HUAS ZL42]|uniref:family 43 glycosylhydrolase n=1 Tax=Streptomyces sp. HUAS ZL42 TaxID=3231715 RepID=UPI00345E165D